MRRPLWLCGQWCTWHRCHQDDPNHDYEYPRCEHYMRNTLLWEELVHRLCLWAGRA